MKFKNDLDFYCPWPVFGESLSEQWGKLRENTATLKPVAKSTLIYAVDTPSFDPDCTTVLAGFEFGEQDFSNKFRIRWDGDNEEFHFQCNTGTTNIPVWQNIFYINCDGSPEKFIVDQASLFTKDVHIEGDFYATVIKGVGDTNTVTITDGTHTLTSSKAKFSVNENDFYLDKDSKGNPKINLQPLGNNVQIVQGQNIQKAINDSPTGGVIDARGTGDMTISSTLTLNGHTLLLGPYTYTVTASIAFRLKSNSKIIGLGQGQTIIIHAANSAVASTPIIRNDDFTNGNSNLFLSNFTLDGNRANQSTVDDVYGIQFQHTSDAEIFKTEIKNAGDYGCVIFHPRNRNYFIQNKVSNCHFEGARQVFFTKTTTTGGFSDTLVIERNFVDGSGSDAGGIAVSSTNTSIVENLSINNNDVIIGHNSTRATLGIEVTVEDSSGSIVRNLNVCHNRVRGLGVAGSNTNGISVSGRNIFASTVSDNKVSHCPSIAIETNCSDLIAQGNTTFKSGRHLASFTPVGGNNRTFGPLTIANNDYFYCLNTTGALNIQTGTDHQIRGILVSGNTIKDPAGNGINLVGPIWQSVIEDNIVESSSLAASGSHALVFSSETNGHLEDSIIRNNNIINWTTGSGIRLSAGNHNRVEWNSFYNVTTEYNFTGSEKTRVIHSDKHGLGINTTTPNHTLHVDGDLFVEGGKVQGPGFYINDLNITGDITGQLKAEDGSASAPEYSFSNAPTTGMYRTSDDRIRIATGGTDRVTIDSFKIFPEVPIWIANGTAADPSYTFNNGGRDTGFFLTPNNSDLAISIDGSEVARFDVNQRFGLLTNAPKATLHVQGDGLFENGKVSAAGFYFTGGGELIDFITTRSAITLSGQSQVDFTQIPSFASRITVLLDQASLSGTDHFLVQIGDSGGIETTGYSSVSGSQTSSSGMIVEAGAGTDLLSGHLTLTNITGNVWVSSHTLAETNAGSVVTGGGRKQLTGILDRVRITRSGTDNLDSGSVNIQIE